MSFDFSRSMCFSTSVAHRFFFSDYDTENIQYKSTLTSKHFQHRLLDFVFVLITKKERNRKINGKYLLIDVRFIFINFFFFVFIREH